MKNNPFDPLEKLKHNPDYCQTYGYSGDNMKLDMDFIREILLAIEDKDDLVYKKMSFGDHSEDKVKKHLQALSNTGFIYAKPYGTDIYVSDLTWEGHEFLEKVRNPETWVKTKAALKKTGEWSLKTTVDIATAIIKAKIDTFIKTGRMDG